MLYIAFYKNVIYNINIFFAKIFFENRNRSAKKICENRNIFCIKTIFFYLRNISKRRIREMTQRSDIYKQTNEELANGIRIAEETEQIGAGIIDGLNDQNDQLRHGSETLDNVESNLQIADRKLLVMTMRLFVDKYFQYTMMICLAIITLGIVFLKWILPLF